MEFDVYCPPPTTREIEDQRSKLKLQLKRARILCVLLFLVWGAGMGYLWKLNFAPPNVIYGIAGGMVGMVLLCRVLGGIRAGVAAAACVVAALASTIAVVAGMTYRDDLPLSVYAGLGGGFALGGLCMLVGSRLRIAQEGLRPLKPVSPKKKAYAEAVELSKKHPVTEAYMSRITTVDRPLLKGEIEALKAWVARATHLSAAAAVPAEPPKAEEPAADKPEEQPPVPAEPQAEPSPKPELETPSVIELPGAEPVPVESGPEEPAEPPKAVAVEPDEKKIVEAEILPENEEETKEESTGDQQQEKR